MNLNALIAGFDALERPLVSDELAIPETITLKRGLLFYTISIKRRVAPGPRLLGDFAELWQGSDEQILHYAQRWGSLGLCEAHALPVLHRAAPCWPAIVLVNRMREEGFAEPLKAWRRYSQRVAAILSLAVEVKAGQPGASTDWRTLFGKAAVTQILETNDERWHRWLFTVALNNLLDDAQPRLRIGLDAAHHLKVMFAAYPALHHLTSPLAEADRAKQLKGRDLVWLYTAGNLLATIALETALVSSGHSGFARCDDCGGVYRPKRSIPPGRYHFCPQCGQRGSKKLHMRRIREEKKSTQKENQ
jgi:hypothetical protein